MAPAVTPLLALCCRLQVFADGIYYMHETSLQTHDSRGMHDSHVIDGMTLLDMLGDPARPAKLIGDKVQQRLSCGAPVVRVLGGVCTPRSQS